jgi:membrane associated rhomboid family serine protease
MASRPASPPRQRDDRVTAAFVIAVLVAVMWVVEIVDSISGGDLERHGIEPHDPDALPAIAAAPFLHGSWGHLIGNTIPFIILGFTIALSGLRKVVWVTLIVAVVAGLGVWIFAPAGTVHIGASGLVFGYATYLIFRGLFSRSTVHIAVGLIVVVLYGGTLLFSLAPRDGISWQGHLFGAIGGVLAAWWLDRRERPGRAPTTTARRPPLEMSSR